MVEADRADIPSPRARQWKPFALFQHRAAIVIAIVLDYAGVATAFGGVKPSPGRACATGPG